MRDLFRIEGVIGVALWVYGGLVGHVSWQPGWVRREATLTFMLSGRLIGLRTWSGMSIYISHILSRPAQVSAPGGPWNPNKHKRRVNPEVTASHFLTSTTQRLYLWQTRMGGQKGKHCLCMVGAATATHRVLARWGDGVMQNRCQAFEIRKRRFILKNKTRTYFFANRFGILVKSCKRPEFLPKWDVTCQDWLCN